MSLKNQYKEILDIVKYIKENAKPNDVVLTLGAGNVTDIGDMILKEN